MLRCDLEPFAPVHATTTVKTKEHNGSKDVQGSNGFQTLEELQRPEEVDSEGQDQWISVIDLEDQKTHSEAFSELQRQQGLVNDAHERKQDIAATKRDKRRHGKRGKKLAIDYTLSTEYWSDLL